MLQTCNVVLNWGDIATNNILFVNFISCIYLFIRQGWGGGQHPVTQFGIQNESPLSHFIRTETPAAHKYLSGAIVSYLAHF